MGTKYRMNIRKKLLLILLAFSLTPLIIVTIMSQQGTKRLGRTISEDSFRNLTKITSKALEQTATISASTLLQSKTALEFFLLLLANQAEKALTTPNPDPSKIYMARHFDDPATAPPDLVISSAYLTKSKAGGVDYQPISFNSPVFISAPEISEQDAADAISRLTPLTKSFKTLTTKFGDSLHCVSVSLENGVHVSYPGHGGYPADYDPRKLAWYTLAADTAGWTFPIIDPVSGLVTFTASKRLHYPDGSFAGVASLDILITNVLAEKQISSLWSTEMRAFMVAVRRNPATREAGLIILAQKQDQENDATRSGRPQREWLLSPESDKSKQAVSQMEITTSGHMELSYNGVDSIWGYAYIEKNTYFVIIVPKSVIVELPNKQRRSVLKHTKKQLSITAATAILVVALLSIAAFFGSKTITRSMRTILSATRRLASGDFSVRINMKARDERQEVFDGFNDMVPRLEENLRVQKTLHLAMEVQQNLLPKADPDINGLDIAGTSIFCEEIGGDYYDYLTFEPDANHRTGVVVGDVSDHGIPSALLMATARSSLRQRISQPGSIATIVHDLNRQLARDVEASGRFMTLFFLTIDLKKKSLEWVRAGHDPAIFYDPAADTFQELRGPGLALGVKEDWVYVSSEKTGLAQGQIIVLGTDGIWEARNHNGDMFTKKPVLRAIRQNADQSARSILTAIIDALSAFLKKPDAEDTTPPFKAEDDITLVVIKIADTQS